MPRSAEETPWWIERGAVVWIDEYWKHHLRPRYHGGVARYRRVRPAFKPSKNPYAR